ncbi:MAG: helicase-related protein, partial [Cetobacterium sp.]
TMIVSYYRTLINKICGVDFLIEAEREKIKEDYKKELEYDAMVIAEYFNWLTETEKKAVDNGKKDMIYYKAKCLSRKEKDIEKTFKALIKQKETDVMETSFVKDNDLVKTVCVLTGEVNGKERDQIIEDTNDGKIKILLVTTVVDKGVSINRLNILYLLFSSRERNVTTQRVGRISRAYPGKKPSMVYDIIYPHYFSTSQFSNRKGDCRMTAHRGFTKIHPSVDLFIWWVSSVISKQPMPKSKEEDFMKNWYKKYVIEI